MENKKFISFRISLEKLTLQGKVPLDVRCLGMKLNHWIAPSQQGSSKSGYVYQSKKNIMYYITVISEKVVATASLFWIPKAFA